MDKNEFTKEAIKEAIKEWLDERFAAFGRWTVMGIAAASFSWFVKMVLAAWWASGGFGKH